MEEGLRCWGVLSCVTYASISLDELGVSCSMFKLWTFESMRTFELLWDDPRANLMGMEAMIYDTILGQVLEHILAFRTSLWVGFPMTSNCRGQIIYCGFWKKKKISLAIANQIRYDIVNFFCDQCVQCSHGFAFEQIWTTYSCKGSKIWCHINILSIVRSIVELLHFDANLLQPI